MNHALTAVVAGLAVAVAINFVLTCAIVRRLREQESKPKALSLPPTGGRAPSISMTDVSGRLVDERFYGHGDVVLAFFEEGCAPCERAKQDLIRKPLRDPLLALVRKGHTEGTDELAQALVAAGATVATFDPDHRLVDLFAIRGFPTFLRVRNGVIERASHRLEDVRDGSNRRGLPFRTSQSRDVEHTPSTAD